MFNLDRLNDFSPFKVRLVARGRGRRTPLTIQEIAKKSGISVRRVHEISRHTRWDDVSVGEAARFCAACGVTFRNASRHRWYLKRTVKGSKAIPLAHLAGLPRAQRDTMLRLLRGEGLVE